MENLVFTQLSVTEVRSLLREEVEAALNAFQPKQPEKETPLGFAQKYISRQEFMAQRNIRSDSTPWLMEQKGKLTPYRFGKEIFYLRSEVDGLIKKAR